MLDYGFFPVGIAPGFDPSHVALSNGGICLLSTVAQLNNQPVAIFPFMPATVINAGAGTATSIIDSILGPVNGATDNRGFQFYQPPTITTTGPTTWAGIIRTPTAAGGNLYKSIISIINSWGFYVHGAGTPITLDFYTSSDILATTALSFGTPYFVAVSYKGGGPSAYFVMKNLATGQVITETVSNSSTYFSTATINIGSDASSESLLSAGGTIACTALTTGMLSLQQLLQWADNPWSFWYPDPVFDISLVGQQQQVLLMMGQIWT